jgi:D-alanyl-D-alanine carboxypeptidase
MFIKYPFSCRSFLLMIACLILVNGTCIGQASSVLKTNQFIANLMIRDSIPGSAVAIIKHGKVIYRNFSGLANLEQATPVNTKSVFQIASVSKQLTAAVIMLLAEQGVIDIREKIKFYLPKSPSTWNNISISMLLAHSSGLINYEDVPGFTEKAFLDSAHSVVIESVLQSLYRQKLRFSPGTKSEYCNSNYFVLGAIIEKVTGSSLEQFLRSHMLQPLQMYNTTVNEMYHIVPNRVAGYSTRNHELINADRLGMNWFFAEGDIITTLDDLIKWTSLPDGTLLKPSSINLMLSAKTLSDESKGKFGYGWFIDSASPIISYHSGHTPGFSAFVYRNAAKMTSIVMLFNNDNVPTPALLEAAKEIDSYY